MDLFLTGFQMSWAMGQIVDHVVLVIDELPGFSNHGYMFYYIH